MAPWYTTQIPGQKRLEAGAPETAWASCPAPRSPVPFLCPGRASPSVSPQHFLPPSPSSPPRLSLSLSPAASPVLSSHLFLSPVSSRVPTPSFSLPPRLPLPFHLPPSLSPPPLKLPVPEARTSKGDQSCAPPSKTRLCQERPPTTPSHPHRVGCNSPWQAKVPHPSAPGSTFCARAWCWKGHTV